MPVQTTEVELSRIFLTEGAYIPDPPNSLYYTLGTSDPITSGTYKGLYTAGGLTESPVYTRLYEIPESGRYARTTDILDYSAAEDATTLNPGNLNGGATQITLQTRLFDDAEEFFTAGLRLADSLNGEIRGTIRGLTLDDETTNVTADSLTALFNVQRALPTQTSTLRNAFTAYLKAVGVSMPVTYEDGLANLAVRLPAQEGNVWEIFKQLAAALQFEIAFVGANMVIRKPRKTSIDTNRETSFTRDINAQDVSQKVRVHYYQNTYGTKKEVYPVPDSPADIRSQGVEYTPSEPTIYTVDAAETVKFTVDLSASLTSVNQPPYVQFVEDRSYDGSNGAYMVVGNDDLPITKAQFDASGGKLSVRLLENQRQIEVTLVGPNDTHLAPYRLAMSSGSGNYYNSLHITGTGLIQKDNYIDLVTGATNQTTAEEIGLEITNPYIGSLGQAITAGQYAAGSKALSYTVSADGYLFNPGSLTFGKVAGARVSTHNSKFRVDTASTGPALTSFTASQDVIIKDANTEYAGMTMGQVSAIWAGRTMLDVSVAPLRNG